MDSENDSVKSAAKGALWKLEGEANHLKQLEAKEQLKDSKATTGDKSKCNGNINKVCFS